MRIDIASVQAREVEKDIAKCTSDSITNGLDIKNEIHKLAKNATKQTKTYAFFLVHNSAIVLILILA